MGGDISTTAHISHVTACAADGWQLSMEEKLVLFLDKTRHEDPSDPPAPSKQTPISRKRTSALGSNHLRRRIRDKAALGVAYGMGTAIGSIFITATITWVQTR
ncbi:hypothetical protein QFZ22_000250 [Streptomyces canus]|uniref:Uncharacterized protein n=1 Tax=Streptomyces canus TaxID=58343 RepID=A0AAW8F586_9ACTN|nr:hypothetical protein [Streptomyces canus]